jgi:hypothetical protein
MVCRATRIRGNLILVGLQEPIQNFPTSQRKGDQTSLMLSKMRLCSVAKKITRPRTPRVDAFANRPAAAGRVVYGATRIRSHLLLLGLQEGSLSFALSLQKSDRTSPILWKMRLCSVAKKITRPRTPRVDALGQE